jgi:hypothetical protein
MSDTELWHRRGFGIYVIECRGDEDFYSQEEWIEPPMDDDHKALSHRRGRPVFFQWGL